ncbi:MAG: hypothetical protein QM703_25875 [Gemmatales bacterium]
MILLSDNDILKKLACFDLFEEFLSAFRCSTAEIFILNTARFVLTSKKMQKRFDTDSFARLTDFLGQVQIITQAPDPIDLAELTEEPTIDAGEAVLFSIATDMENAILATGDKRSLIGLVEASVDENPAIQRIVEQLSGKVISFELIIERIIDVHGFETVRNKLVKGCDHDKTIALVLGSALDANEEKFREGLVSYINDLRKNTSTLLRID